MARAPSSLPLLHCQPAAAPSCLSQNLTPQALLWTVSFILPEVYGFTHQCMNQFESWLLSNILFVTYITLWACTCVWHVCVCARAVVACVDMCDIHVYMCVTCVWLWHVCVHVCDVYVFAVVVCMWTCVWHVCVHVCVTCMCVCSCGMYVDNRQELLRINSFLLPCRLLRLNPSCPQ